MDVIVSHANTDFDAFASMVACRRLYPGAVVALAGSLNRNVRDFSRLHAEELALVEASRLDREAIERLIVIEVADPTRLGELQGLVTRSGVEVVLFDHHERGSTGWPGLDNVVLGNDGALTTTLVGILAEREVSVSRLEATVFALGIHEDTGSLTYPTTTLRDAEALAWCLRHGAQQEMIVHYLHTALSEQERGLLDALLASVETIPVNGVEILVAAAAWPVYLEGVSNLAHKLLDLTECRGLVCLVEMNASTLCVVRSRIREFDAAALARALGGGGHPQAASATVHESLATARARVVAALLSAVRRPVRAIEIMSRPARFVAPDETVAQAMIACQRHRQSGIQVGSRTELAGVVTREDLDKAIGHGLSHAPVKAVMTSDVPTCTEDALVQDVQRLLASTHTGRVAVIRAREIVGVVTRTDLLRALGEPAHEPPAIPPHDLRERLLALTELSPVFEAIQALGEPFDGVYLVGGTVRDIVLGEAHFDVDIAVEGDGISFGRSLAQALGGRAVPHEKFGTAVVKWPGGRVDVATARTEFYDEPAALPAVEQASIRQDLFRRDFTINAMATSLKGEDFGRSVDPFGGLHDLDRGVVRVLHNLSFIDDPTRIFRAIRYENRYGFAMDGHTVALARACIEMGLVGELSSARLRDELVLLLGEERVSDSVLRLDELGLLAFVHPHLLADRRTVELIERLDGLRAHYAPREPAWRLRLAVLARRLPPDELYDWFGRLRLRRRDADVIADAVTVAPKLREHLAAVSEPAEAQRAIAPHDAAGALLALATASPEDSRASTWLRRYFGELRSVRLEISGGDLAALGIGESPRVGEILDELLRRKLNGELAGEAAELAAAKELIGAT